MKKIKNIIKTIKKFFLFILIKNTDMSGLNEILEYINNSNTSDMRTIKHGKKKNYFYLNYYFYGLLWDGELG